MLHSNIVDTPGTLKSIILSKYEELEADIFLLTELIDEDDDEDIIEYATTKKRTLNNRQAGYTCDFDDCKYTNGYKKTA